MIRDQLLIKKEKHGFNSFAPRRNYMDSSFPTGKRFPSLTYQHLIQAMEPRILARQKFFRSRQYRYSGWSLSEDWDAKLRAEEKTRREEGKKLGSLCSELQPPDGKPYRIGKTVQERLRAASTRELTYRANKPRLRKCLSPIDAPGGRPTGERRAEVGKNGGKTKREDGERKDAGKDKPDGNGKDKGGGTGAGKGLAERGCNLNKGSKRVVIGNKKYFTGVPMGLMLKGIGVDHAASDGCEAGKKSVGKKAKKCWRYEKNSLYLPIVFSWMEMDSSRGYPPIRAEVSWVC